MKGLQNININHFARLLFKWSSLLHFSEGKTSICLRTTVAEVIRITWHIVLLYLNYGYWDKCLEP